jgi:hypothetical protein
VAFQSIASPTEHYLVTTNPAELSAYAETQAPAAAEDSFVDLVSDEFTGDVFDAEPGSQIDLDAA